MLYDLPYATVEIASASNITGGAAGMAFTAPVAPRIPQMPSRKVWEKLSSAAYCPQHFARLLRFSSV